jgi:hypothetical protein
MLMLVNVINGLARSGIRRNLGEKMRYWKIAPGQGGFLWVEQRDRGCIAIGWSEVGNLKKYKTREQLGKAFKRAGCRSKPHQLWRFYTRVSPGDKVVASSGKFIYGFGTVKGDYVFDESLHYQHSKPVRWELKFWAPLDVRDLSLPNKLVERLGRNRTILELTQREWALLDEVMSQIKSPFEGFTNFEGICRAPETEQEVLILFSKLSQHLRMKIEYVGTKFPDALVRVKKGKNWVTKGAEFEKYSSGFKSHMKKYSKDPKSCDMIICWIDDWEQKPKNLEVVELKKELEDIL